MTAVEFVGAIGNDQGEMPGAECSDQKVEQVAGRAIRPMKILDHQDERGALGQARQQREDTTEELDLVELVAERSCRNTFARQAGNESAEIGNGTDEFTGEFGLIGRCSEIAKGVHEGNVGESDVSPLHATSDKDTSASFSGSAGEFGE